MMRKPNKKGFTLLELSLVLVVIGLLSAAIVLGKDLVNSAELRATARQVEMFDTAIHAFRLRYDCLPGDCKNAASFGFKPTIIVISAVGETPSEGLGFISSARANIASPDAPLQTTVNVDPNGNGDGRINYDEPRSMPGILAEAHLIDPYMAVSGQVPLKLSHAVSPLTHQQAFFMSASMRINGRSLADQPSVYHMITGTAVVTRDGTATIKAEDIYRLDSKYDDGLPLSGVWKASNEQEMPELTAGYSAPVLTGPADISNPLCVINDSGDYHRPMTGSYNLANPASLCVVQIRSL